MYYLCTAIERIASWCNGSTTDFGSACRGSNPREATMKNPNYLKQNSQGLLHYKIHPQITQELPDDQIYKLNYFVTLILFNPSTGSGSDFDTCLPRVEPLWGIK